MRYFKNEYWIFEITDDLTKYRWIYNLETKEHLKYPWWNAYPGEWENDIELTKKEVFIELL